jgi:hypothetical protein
MRKSSSVPAALCAATAILILEGCSSSEATTRRCADSAGNILPDSVCEKTTRYVFMDDDGVKQCVDTTNYETVADSNCVNQDTMRRRSGGGGMGNAIVAAWVYGGIMRGNRITGQSYMPPPGQRINSPSGRTVSRGGFGGSGGFFSGSGG